MSASISSAKAPEQGTQLGGERTWFYIKIHWRVTPPSGVFTALREYFYICGKSSLKSFVAPEGAACYLINVFISFILLFSHVADVLPKTCKHTLTWKWWSRPLQTAITKRSYWELVVRYIKMTVNVTACQRAPPVVNDVCPAYQLVWWKWQQMEQASPLRNRCTRSTLLNIWCWRDDFEVQSWSWET